MEDYSSLEADAPRPRLCHIRKRPDFSGYGFNLHAEKGQSGHYIGKIDPDSPAEAAGLREGDRIVEVNGTNIGNENHQQVVERIRVVPDETKFLVVDAETDEYYKQRKIVVSSGMPNVHLVETPLELNHVDDQHAEAEARTEVEPGRTYSGRLCKLRSWSDYPGYGFNLHAEKGHQGQFIGKVDEESPAEAAGLQEGDRIVAVNGVDVVDKTHSDVVKLIRTEVGRVDLLVVDAQVNSDFDSAGTRLTTSAIDVIETIECPLSNPHTATTVSDTTDVIAPPVADAEAQAAEVAEVAAAAADYDVVTDTQPTNAAAAAAGEDEEKVSEAPPPESHGHHARLCHVVSWPNGNGYGFSMQAEKGRVGQFIGKVDPESPAHLAGLRFGDRIVEVNGSNTDSLTHKEVVQKIREHSGEVRLLVVDPEADEYFRAHEVRIHSLMDAIELLASPSSDPNQSAADDVKTLQKSADDQSMVNLTLQTSVASDDNYVADYEQVTNEIAELANSQSLHNDATDWTTPSPTTTTSTAYYNSTSYTTTPASSVTSSSTVHTSPSAEVTSTTTPSTYNSVTAPPVTITTKTSGFQPTPAAAVVVVKETPPPPKGPVVIGGVEFAASAEEARKRVSKKRDKTSRASNMSLKDKYALYQKL